MTTELMTQLNISITERSLPFSAFCPYHIGHFTIMGFKLKSYINGAHFEGMLTTLCGYCIIGLSLVILHTLTRCQSLKPFFSLFLGVIR
jgi:hypothetical protein